MTVYTRHQTPPAAADPPGPAGLWMPWYTGLGELCVPCYKPCSLCLNGQAPKQVQIVLAGVTNGTCSDCGDINGTYTLDWVGIISGTCSWKYIPPNAPCGFSPYYFWVVEGPSPIIYLDFWFRDSIDLIHTWRSQHSQSAKPNCMTLDNHELRWWQNTPPNYWTGSVSGGCSSASGSSTCFVTAL